MRISPRQIAFSLIVFFTLSLTAQVESYLDVKSYEDFQHWSNRVNSMQTESADSTIYLYQLAYDHFLEQKDTLNAVNSLVEIAINYGHLVQYQSAYDNLWKALLLADLAQNDAAKVVVYLQLGRYYSFYKRKEKAFEYFDRALNLSKSLVSQGILESFYLVDCYYAFCSTYRELDNPEQAKIYLDSCYQFTDNNVNGAPIYYQKFELAYIISSEGNHRAALDTLLAIAPWFDANNPRFNVFIFTYIGDNYLKLEEYSVGEQFYQKALTTSRKFNSHLDFTPIIHKKLADLYITRGEILKALNNVKKESELDAQFFDSRSPINRSLLEIKDEFRVEKEKQKQLLQEQRLKELENEERVAFLKTMLLLITIAALIFAGVLYFDYIRKKHKVEKALIRKKKELEVAQTNELLELKNRELATSSLKLIEKDEILATLKDRLSQGSGDIKANELKKIVRTISHSNAQNWEEFEARFLSVNKDFYGKINTKFPKLTRGDQKVCALIKLNLSSKEMAKLMGISIESVHTSRYRLRKKLNLTKEVSLTEFIATL